MSAESGASHAVAAFVSSILGSLLSNYPAAHRSVLRGRAVQWETGP